MEDNDNTILVDISSSNNTNNKYKEDSSSSEKKRKAAIVDNDENNEDCSNNTNNKKRKKKAATTNGSNNPNNNSGDNDEKMSETNKNNNNNDTVSWGTWMGSWKTSDSDVDKEAERIDRQKAAFGGETISRLKDLNVLVLGCKGVGVETAKNLILSNVGSVLIWDNEPCTMADRGTNFYITDEDVLHGGDAKKSRAEASVEELKSLNPYCRVDIVRDQTGSITDGFLTDTNVCNTGRPFAVVVVTTLLPKQDLYRINRVCRERNITFIMAITNGVTSSIFSDFGTNHEITDLTGEPTQTLAISNIELFPTKPKLLHIQGYKDDDNNNNNPLIIVTVAQNEHGLDDGDIVTLDDMRADLLPWNGKQLQVKRVAIASPTEAKLDTSGVAFKEALKLPTGTVVSNFERQYDFYKEKHEKENTDGKKKFPVRSITMFNRLALVLPDDSKDLDAFSTYQAGGLLNQVRLPTYKSYSSLEETLESGTPVPQMLRGEEWELGKGIEIHLSISAVLEFHEKEQRWPGIHSTEDAESLYGIAQTISEKRRDKQKSDDGKSYCWAQKVEWGFPSSEERELEKDRILRYAKLFSTELTGFCAFLGGTAAQEVLKKSGKFTPINQWIHHDEPSLVIDECATNITPSPIIGSRYDHQIAIMGKDFQRQMSNQNIFLVGCGALGCEYLKGLALMGAGTGKDGKIYVTDMDRIEVSNLSRQFLFRQDDVGHPKSVRGALAVQKWNSDLNIEALERKVGSDTEDFFNDNFWESIDLCWNALDNVLARKYTDSQCLFYSKPLLESGTLGTKCNHEVILPYRTSSYNDGNEDDSNENQIAMCTLRSFPYLPIHCIEFAKQAYFSDYFEFGPEQYETFRKDKVTFFEQLESMDMGEQYKSLSMISSYLELQKSADGAKKIDFALCVRVAFDRMMEDFRTSILNLCHSADTIEKSTGKKFWTGTKRRPRPVDWNSTDKDQLMEYLYCTSGLYGSVWKVDDGIIRDRGEFQALVEKLDLKQPEWSPPDSNVNLNEDENDDEDMMDGDAGDKVEKLKSDLYSVDVSNLQSACPQDFEKDDDLNFHIDFITSATNLRSWNYDIKSTARHTVKVTAGRIIPALATTTAMVCGLVDIEFCKLVLGLQNGGREKFLNSNINLAAGSNNFTTFCPDPPVPISTGLAQTPKTFTSWDKIEISSSSSNNKNEFTVEQLVRYIETSLGKGISVNRIFQYGTTEDKAIYNAKDKQKLDWDIVINEDGDANNKTVTLSNDSIYSQWPQIRMAVQILNRGTLPSTSGQKKMFLKQVSTVQKSLNATKESFMEIYRGPVSSAFTNTYRPKSNGDDDDDAIKEKQQYFDTVSGSKNYLVLGVDCSNEEEKEEEDDIILPPIKYVFST